MQTTTEPTNKVYAMVLTIVVHIALFLIFFFLVIRTPIPPYPVGGGSGIDVNFGTSDNGLGDVQPENYLPVDLQNNETNTNIETSDNSNNNDDVLTQSTNEAPVIENGNKINKKTTNTFKVETKTEIKINVPIVNPLALYKKNTKGGNEGETNGNGDQGNPNGTYNSKNHYGNPGNGNGGNGNGDGTGVGDGTGNGISYSLNGRKPNNLTKPIYNSNETGKVVVTITVDKYGNVIKADAGAKGTTTTAQDLWKLAEEAALKSKFNANPNAAEEQKGTITYIFIRQN